jgi:hypothetical protein
MIPSVSFSILILEKVCLFNISAIVHTWSEFSIRTPPPPMAQCRDVISGDTRLDVDIGEVFVVYTDQ